MPIFLTHARRFWIRRFCLWMSWSALVLAGNARADAVGPEDAPCRTKNEGEMCFFEEDFPGVCETVELGEGRARRRCIPAGKPLTERQRACVGVSEGNECTLPSGASGVCKPGEKRRVEDAGPPWNGVAEHVFLECRRSEEATKTPWTVWAVSGGALLLGIVFIAFLRRKTRTDY